MENDFVKNEHKILKFWEENKVFENLKEKNKNGKPWSFLDGPITANNSMGVHHAWGRTLKDLFQRFKAMQGFSQRFQNGFDCQGLWVEVEVEKELGFKNKKDIEQYGIEKFVNKCKERAHKYSKIQTGQSIRLGMLRDWGNWQTDFDEKGEWINQSHSYYTLSDENNYAIWHFLKKCHEKGLLYKGHDVVPWCPRCGTAISQHEILTEEYKEITHKAIYFRLNVVGQPHTFFLVWTTTPWTLPANVFLSAHPDLEYAKVKDKNGDIYILLKDKSSLIDKGEVLESFWGKELAGLKYYGLFDEFPAVAKALENYEHQVYLWKDITQEEGTGIVHSAPGCGQEDFQLGKEMKLPVVNPTDNESRYVEGFDFLSGIFVGEEKIRDEIFNYLRLKGLVYKIEDYKHRYPTCWRCKAELIFRLVDEWYIAMDKLRDPLIKAVEKINWMPGFCKERELDWLRNMHDWLISKKRYWGLALPIYECRVCKNFDVVGSFDELKERAVEGWQEFFPLSGYAHSPHRPWIDAIKIKCSKCGEIIPRILDVGTPWLDAGIVPFSTVSDDNRSKNMPYFNNRQEWDKWFPAELVCEGFPGQFKNWFYVLLAMSQVLEEKPPFNNLLGFANVVDEKGEEMHKSKGNAIWFDDAVEKTGADVMRWMYSLQNPANNMRFGYNVVKETGRKILTLTNCMKFFETYSGEISNSKVQNLNKYQNLNSKNILDKWIFSKLNNLIKESTEGLEKFDSVKPSQAIENFWIYDLSLWYVRRSRKRFQSPESQEDKEAAEKTFHYILITLARLLTPFMPFLAEEIYQKLTGQDYQTQDSVHLCEWPECNAKAIDQNLEANMDKIRAVASLALAKRAEANISVRQKLSKAIIKDNNLQGKDELLEILKDEINVSSIAFDEKMESEVKLDTEITDELKEEGVKREIIRHIQDLRKKAGLVPADRVLIHFAGDKKIGEILLRNKEDILTTVKADNVQENQEKSGEFLAEKEFQLDDAKFWLAIANI